MKKLTYFLLRINKFLYKTPYHLLILVLWVSSFLFDLKFLHYWFSLGLLIWIGLFIYRLAQDSFSTKELKEGWAESGFLGYLVGLNLCVVLGILSFPVIGLLAYVSNKEKKEPQDPQNQ